MSARQPIPATQHADPNHQMAADAVRLHVEQLTGQDRNADRLVELPTNATLADVINTINIIIRRLGG